MRTRHKKMEKSSQQQSGPLRPSPRTRNILRAVPQLPGNSPGQAKKQTGGRADADQTRIDRNLSEHRRNDPIIRHDSDPVSGSVCKMEQ